MPTQQKNLISDSKRDAAAHGHDVSIASRDATDSVTAAVRPHATIAVPDDAWSEKQAAGPPGASTRNVLSLLRRCWRLFQEGRRRQRVRVTLGELSEREMIDIGVTSAEIEYIAAHRALERLRDGTAYLWMSR